MLRPTRAYPSVTVALVPMALLFACNANASTTTLDDISRGAYTQAGSFGTGSAGTSSGNYVTGFYNGGGASEYRSFFTFDLAALSGSVTSAQFDVSRESGGVGSPVTFKLYLYTQSISSLDSGTAGVAGFTNLGSGTLLGSAIVNPSVTSGTLSIALDGAALSAISAAEGGTFAIGGAVTGVPPTNYIFAASLDNPATELVVNSTPVPLPAAAWLLVSGIGGLGWFARKKRDA
jgi:hypothetical protein